MCVRIAKRRTLSGAHLLELLCLKQQKTMYSDVWDNLNHSSTAAAVKLLASSTNKGGSRPEPERVQI